jgi:hypothetical protein
MKMNRSDVVRSIAQAWKFASDIDAGRTISDPNPLSVNVEFRDACLDSSADYATIYETGLKLSHYNFSLMDYSYFQFSWEKEDVVRYAFYPNPYLSGDKDAVIKLKRWRELLSAEMISYEDFLDLLRGRPADVRVPVIRYENSPDQYRSLKHPCSHMHIGHHSDNRWALDRLLTPSAFTLLILKQYYGQHWALMEDESATHGNSLEEKLIAEKRRCKSVPEEYFCGPERSSFYFG